LDAKRSEIRVGIAVLISLVILVGGIMWGKGISLRAKRYVIEVVFDNVGGLESGANVLANGVVKGRVQRILLQEGKVRVIASIDKTVTIYSDYKISVESPTVMAGKALSINPGEKLPPADITRPLQGQSPLGMTEAVETFQVISSDLQVVMRDLDTLLVNLNHVASDSTTRFNITNTIAQVNELAEQSNRWVKTNSESMTSALKQLDATLSAAQEMVKSDNSPLNRTLLSADSAAQRLSALSGSLQNLVGKLTAGDGTASKLINDDEFYLKLNHMVSEVDSLAKSIRTKGMKQRIVLF
jgi:phospholipid/cholesterol/gamma-HCH transport system substrate-binding protein